ncbi:hypothetical protein MARGE09_P0560 [Marinagarivorans cellulosilyticus]|uniref:TonB-dependent receptor n=2 Tax=Marinagarivorans cellulosilyticus TaxID=2721545 RepID=A0AAN2BIV2_9GAMM|nr:hypothetical protein MARGE09_P0560 [Marinagarivorans cellulosilyticus]
MPTHAQSTENPNSEQQSLGTLNFANRSLGNLLFTYQKSGYNLIFSDRLVDASLIIKVSPSAGAPIQRLKRLLAHYQLGLLSDGNSGWLITQATASRQFQLNLHDANTQQPINNASISIDNIPVAHPPRAIALYAGAMQQLTVKAAGYHTLERPLDTLANNVILELQPITTPLIEETLVTASFYQWKKTQIGSQNTLDNIDIKSTPTRGNDPVQAIANLPGVAGSGVSAKPNIRGGADDELLILLDGIELNDPFHLKDFQGLLSGINSHIVDSVAVYTGGYPARYGSKMSGVMDIQPVIPTAEASYNNTLEFNPIYSAITLGHVLKNDENYLLFAARRGNLETTLGQINPDIGAPRFNDTFTKYHWITDSQARYDIGLYSLRDDVELRNVDGDEGETAKSIDNSQYAWLRNQRLFGQYQHNWQLINSYNKNERNGAINEPNNPDESTGSLQEQQHLQSYAAKYHGEWAFLSGNSLAFGGHIKYAKARYTTHAQALRGELATLLGNERIVDNHLQISTEGLQFATYLSYQNTLADQLQLESGLRLDGQTFTGKLRHQLSPRLAARYQYNDHWAIKASAGRFYQAPNIKDLKPADGEITYYTPQKSDHYILGMEYAPSRALTLSAETYLKRIFNPRTRYENMFNPYALLPELAPDRIAIKPDSASAKGLETTVTYAPSNPLKLWAAYSFSEVEDVINGEVVRRSWNQVSSLHFGALVNRHHWSLSTQVHWHSGRPTTTLPSTVSDLTTPIEYQRNSASLPDYITLDIRLSRQWTLNSSQLELYLDITNASNRKNIGFYEVEIAAQNNSYSLERNPERLFPILPTLGLYWYF